jgi:hypothetical protein
VEIACDLQFAEHRKRPVGKAERRTAQILAASVRYAPEVSGQEQRSIGIAVILDFEDLCSRQNLDGILRAGVEVSAVIIAAVVVALVLFSIVNTSAGRRPLARQTLKLDTFRIYKPTLPTTLLLIRI